MNRDELSSVLLKVIGFTVAAHAIMGLAQPIIGLGYYYIQELNPQMGWQIVAVLIGAAAQVGGGLLIIAKSAAISEWLFAFGQDKSGTTEAAGE